jgi:hypothetical protein
MAVDRKRTLDIARDWKAAGYYDKAEQGEWVDVFWGSGTEFRRLFETLDRRVLIDLACGHGRHSARLLHDAGLKESIEKLHLLDINAENVKFCRERFLVTRLFSPIGTTGSISDLFGQEPSPEYSVTMRWCTLS